MNNNSPEYKEWHQAKITTVAILLGLTIQFGAFIWQGATMVAELKAVKVAVQQVPALTERVIRLEIMASEQGKINRDLRKVIEKLDNTVDRIDKEQAKRTPLVYDIKRK